MNAQFALFRPRDPVGRRETPGAPPAMTRDPAGFTSKSWVWLTCVTSSPSSGPWPSAPASVRCGCFCGAVSGLLFELQKHNAPWPAPRPPAWPPRCRHPESRAPRPPMRRGLQVPAPRGPVVLVLRSLTPPQVRGRAMTWDAVSPRGRCPPRLPGATCCCRFHSPNRRGRLPGIFLRLVISAMEDAAGLRSHDRSAARLFSWGGREPRKEGDECGIKATASGEGAAARGSTPVN